MPTSRIVHHVFQVDSLSLFAFLKIWFFLLLFKSVFHYLLQWSLFKISIKDGNSISLQKTGAIKNLPSPSSSSSAIIIETGSKTGGDKLGRNQEPRFESRLAVAKKDRIKSFCVMNLYLPLPCQQDQPVQFVCRDYV